MWLLVVVGLLVLVGGGSRGVAVSDRVHCWWGVGCGVAY